MCHVPISPSPNGCMCHSDGRQPQVRIATISDFRRAWESERLEWMVRLPDGSLTMRIEGHTEGGEAVTSAAERVKPCNVEAVLPCLMWHHDVLEVDSQCR